MEKDSKEDNYIIECSHLGTNIKTQCDMNGIIDNTTVRKLVLIYKNRRKFHPVLSTTHVLKFQNDNFNYGLDVLSFNCHPNFYQYSCDLMIVPEEFLALCEQLSCINPAMPFDL